MQDSSGESAPRPLQDVLRRNPLFRRLWTAQLISQTGDWLSRTAILGLLSSLGAHDATLGVGALYAAELATRLVPNALLYPLAGPAADRLPRRLLLVGADVVRVLIVLALLLVREPGDLPLLYTLIIAQVAFGTFFAAAQSAAIPSTIQDGELHDAYAVSSATWSFTLSLGAALGGLVVRVAGVPGALLMDATTYVISATLLFRLRLPPVPHQAQAFHLRDILLFTDLRRGFAHARERGVAAVLLAKTFWGGAGGFLVALSLLSSERFGGSSPSPGQVGLVAGLFYASRGVGTGLGPILARHFGGSSDRNLRIQMLMGYALGALGYGLLAFSHQLLFAFLLVAVAHAGGSMLWVASTTFWQRRVDNAFRGRIFALEFIGMTLSFAFGGGIAAWVYDSTGNLNLMLWTSCALVLAGGFTWSLLSSPRRSSVGATQ